MYDKESIQNNQFTEYTQALCHKVDIKNQLTAGESMTDIAQQSDIQQQTENSKQQTLQFHSKRNPAMKVTLEFSNKTDDSQARAVEQQFKDTLLPVYLEKIVKGSIQSGTPALLSSPRKGKEGKSHE